MAPATLDTVDATPHVTVWDLPLRLFHWLLLVAVTVAIATGLTGGEWMAWHGRAGLAIVGLVTFRTAWGVMGSTTSRFTHFFPTPARLRAYLAGQWHGVGHNPLGALSVFALLGLLALQAGTGLFSNDDIAFAGPLSAWVGEDTVHDLTAWHHRLVNILYGLLGLHVAAIAFYAAVKRERLVPPMVTGRKAWDSGREVPQGTSVPRAWALVLSLALALAAVWLADGGWQALTPAAPEVAAPTKAAPAW
jgi:cytochrome b